MAKYHKKLVKDKTHVMFESFKYILIGYYDSSQPAKWKQLKTDPSFINVDFHIPKNAICRLALEDLKHPISNNEMTHFSISQRDTRGFFEGPVFFVCSNDANYLAPVLSKLMERSFHIYGGFLDKKLMTFADVKELQSILKSLSWTKGAEVSTLSASQLISYPSILCTKVSYVHRSLRNLQNTYLLAQK